MKEDLKYTLMVIGMIVSWSVYYAVSKVVVNATGSPLLAGFLLRSAALVFLTIQLLLDGNFRRLFHQGKAALILVVIGVFGFDIVAFIFGGQNSIGARIIYTIVALAGIWCISVLFRSWNTLSERDTVEETAAFDKQTR